MKLGGTFTDRGRGRACCNHPVRRAAANSYDGNGL